MASACVFLPLFLVEASQRPWLTGLSTSTCPVTVNAVIMNSIQMLKSCKYSITMIVPHYTPAGKLRGVCAGGVKVWSSRLTG